MFVIYFRVSLNLLWRDFGEFLSPRSGTLVTRAGRQLINFTHNAKNKEIITFILHFIIFVFTKYVAASTLEFSVHSKRYFSGLFDCIIP